MLKYRLLHPELLRALGEAGHGAQVLIADGNYPLRDALARRARGTCTSTSRRTWCASRTCLASLVDAIPIEAAHVMTPGDGRGAARCSPSSARSLPGLELSPLSRFDFYDAASALRRRRRDRDRRAPDLCQPAAHDRCRGARRIARPGGIRRNPSARP